MATKATTDARENQKAMEKLHIFENKLFLAEQNREKGLQKKLATIRRHVGFHLFHIKTICFFFFYSFDETKHFSIETFLIPTRKKNQICFRIDMLRAFAKKLHSTKATLALKLFRYMLKTQA